LNPVTSADRLRNPEEVGFFAPTPAATHRAMHFALYRLPLATAVVALIVGFASARHRQPVPDASTPSPASPLTVAGHGSTTPEPGTSGPVSGGAPEDSPAYELWTPDVPALGFLAGQDASPPKQNVPTYVCEPIRFERAQLERAKELNYWRQRTARDLDLVLVKNGGGSRTTPVHELEAVHATAWTLAQQSRAASEERVAAVLPSNGPGAPAQPVLYVFDLKAGKVPGRREVSVRFVAEGDAATAEMATAAAASGMTNLSTTTLRHAGFPGDDEAAYWRANPGIQAAIHAWIHQAGSGNTGRVLVFDSPTSASFHVGIRQAPGGSPREIDIRHLGSGKPLRVSFPAEALARDGMDDALSRLTMAGPPGKPFLLGKIHGWSGVPEAERPGLKCVIHAYLSAGTRQAEVDVRVPVPAGPPPLFTLRFQPGDPAERTDVLVTRLEDSLVAGGPPYIDLQHIRDCPPEGSSVELLQRWWKARYPAFPVADADPVALRSTMAGLLTTRAQEAAWFEGNYGIVVLDAAKAGLRMKSMHRWAAAQVAELGTFTGDELLGLERALQTLDTRVLAAIRGTHFVRQHASTGAGLTLTQKRGRRVEARTIVILDPARGREDDLFLGGSQGVVSPFAATCLHELGHVAGSLDGMQAAFNKELGVKGLTPVTRYAGTHPEEEYFPEVFALFHADPEWLQDSHPPLFAWLQSRLRNL
jgi:hypothetical protein